MPLLCYFCGMARTRVSTTVDERLLTSARSLRAGSKDAELLDEALACLIKSSRDTEIDAQIEAGYKAHPLSEPDEWGDLAGWHEAND